MISLEFNLCVKTRYVAVHSTVDPVAAPLNVAVGIHQRGPLLHRRNVTRGWTELTRRKFEDLDALPATRCGWRALG
jgi:hypothetical protein